MIKCWRILCMHCCISCILNTKRKKQVNMSMPNKQTKKNNKCRVDTKLAYNVLSHAYIPSHRGIKKEAQKKDLILGNATACVYKQRVARTPRVRSMHLSRSCLSSSSTKWKNATNGKIGIWLTVRASKTAHSLMAAYIHSSSVLNTLCKRGNYKSLVIIT